MTLGKKTVILTVKNGKAICPVCNWDGQIRINEDTRLENFPFYCRHCKQTTIVSTQSQSHRARAD